MSYQVLARKWRPKSFAEVVGQEHVLTVLSNALSLGRVHHAYLFSGSRGVGKTSIARLLAKGLNCEQGITATPCGKCDNCRDIEQGRFIDLLEIDAASRTKVEDTREILDNIQYLPTKGRFKVYLIDEVHMLSRSSFNALLKTLEEPPEHVKFLLATTDPQKLPITILSRCLHLHLGLLTKDLIKQQLVKILIAENIGSEDKALQLLAKAANGSMRDALSLTDQAIALGNGAIDTQSVSIMLGTLDKAIPFDIIDALYQSDGNQLMQQIAHCAQQGIDWDNLLTEVLALLHQISLLQLVPSALGDYSDDEERMRHLAQQVSPNDIQLFYQILLMGRKELIYAPDKKIGVEMSLLRALAFAPKAYQSSANESVANQQLTNSEHAEKKSPINISRPSSATIATTTANIEQQTSLAKVSPANTASPKIVPAISESKDDIDDTISDVTKSILAARQQIIDSDKTPKKPKQVERNRPEIKPQGSNKKLNIAQHSVEQAVRADTAKDSAEDSNNIIMETAETYQWQFSEHFTPSIDNSLNAKDAKQAFEHQITAELNQKLIIEAAQMDSWSGEIESLTLPPLIKQIAINAYLETTDEENQVLHLRSALAHLVRSATNTKRLADALTEKRGKPCQLTVVIDDDPTLLTPLDVREKIYQTKLAQARQLIQQDNKIDMICQLFEARIDEESIRPI